MGQVRYTTEVQAAGDAVLTVSGEVDLDTAPALREQLVDLFQQGDRRIVLDMAQVEFLDSTGLGVLVAALKRFRSAGGDIVLRDISPREQRLFELTGLTRIFTIEA